MSVEGDLFRVTVKGSHESIIKMMNAALKILAHLYPDHYGVDWEHYHSKHPEVEISGLVQRTKAAVGSGGVFKGCTSFAGATLPKSIKQVSFDAFDGCPCEDEVYSNLPEDKIC